MNKVCFFFECYYLGGLDTFTYNLINNWNPSDSLTLICNKSHSGAKLFEKNIHHPNCTIEIHDMSMANDWVPPIKKIGYLFYIISYFLHAPYYILFGYKKLKLNRFDYLHVINGGYPAGLSSRCIPISWYLYKRKRSVHNFHNMYYNNGWPLYLFDRIIDKWVIHSTSKFVSVSKLCAESLRESLLFKKLDNICYVYNGINDNFIKATFNLRERFSIPQNAIVLLMLATYEKRKGHKFIIDVFEKIYNIIPNAHLFFFGYGKDEEIETVVEYAKSKKLLSLIHCCDYVPNPMEYLQQSNLLLIGSQSDESFGLTSIEAMKYHKVVLSTNTGGLKEVIKDGEGGFLFEKWDVEGMASKCIELLSDESLMSKQQELGYRRYTNNFTAKRMSERYRELLLES